MDTENKIQISAGNWISPPKLKLGLYCITKRKGQFFGCYITGIKYHVFSNDWIYDITINGVTKSYFFNDIPVAIEDQ